MTITVDETTQTFHLRAGTCSYILQVHHDGYLAHRYFGPRLGEDALAQPLLDVDRAFSPQPNPQLSGFSADTLPQEYPSYGRSDFRVPAFEVRFPDGSSVSDLRYRGHQIVAGKPKLAGLPATYVDDEAEADTLVVEMADALSGLTVLLTYTAYREANVVTRSAQFTNRGTGSVQLLRALSMAIDLPDCAYDLTHLSGAWARERDRTTRRLTAGSQGIESRRGASSHQQNPFLALSRPGASETSGEVIGISLVYSGNFLAGAEVDQFGSTRVTMGINPFDFSWLLAPGASFQTPEAVLVFSACGFGDMSRTFHRLYRSRLARGRYRDAVRPVLINNWEATYFQFTADSLLRIAETARALGVDLFVLDDGWFGHRDNDQTSLGDWIVDKRKLPNGLADLVERMNARGLQFGLWFEPEMVSPDSNLYRAHPDWCLHVPNRDRSEGRNQLVLDFSRPEVCDAVIAMVSTILASAPIRYVKWDMNRHMTEIGSSGRDPERQRETAHRYMLGLYHVLETITTQFPDILFESCSGGGGRFDAGMLHYMPQIWTSDNTDAVSRLAIQFGTSLVYPASAIGAHVSAVPNHQVGRLTPLFTRGIVAMMGNFGYELDVTKLNDVDRDTMRQQIALYKEIQELVLFGNLYRLLDPHTGIEAASEAAAWMYVDPAQQSAIISCVRVLQTANAGVQRLKPRGLQPAQRYRVTLHGLIAPMGYLRDGAEWRANGDELMYAGLTIPALRGDYAACYWRLQAD